MKTLNTRELNEVMGRGLQIIERFCKRNVARDTDYNNLYDYLMSESMNYYYKLLDSNNEVNEKTILNCFWHAINVLKLRHGILNNTCKVDKSVNEFIKVYGKNKKDLEVISNDIDYHLNNYGVSVKGTLDNNRKVLKFGSGKDNGEYNRIIKSKYKIDRNNYIDYQSIANTYTNKSVRNAVEHGCFYVSIDDNEVLKNTLYSGLNPADELIKMEQVNEVKKTLKPMFNDVNFTKFELIIKSEKTNTDTERKIKNRFKNKYPFLKELEKSEIIYLINTYKA